jgi:hypothetical protein
VCALELAIFQVPEIYLLLSLFFIKASLNEVSSKFYGILMKRDDKSFLGAKKVS